MAESTTSQTIDDRYIVQGVLGRGAMGCVVQAFDQLLGRRVALKLMKRGPPEALARFAREARAVARLQSEHVARVLDARVSDQGQPYIAMEYLVGHTLATLLERQGAFSPSVACEYLVQACDALREAHSLSIIHRDIKPSNLFLAERRNGSRLIKVLDFGISKGLGAGETAAPLTLASTIIGTPKYISPERLQGLRAIDARSDVWSLGAVLYELLAGEPAFPGEGTAAVIAKIVSGEVPQLRGKRPDVPRTLSAIVSKCLEPEPDRRYPHAGELGQALRTFLAEQQPTRTRTFETPTIPSAVRQTSSQDPTDKVNVVRATPRAQVSSGKRSSGAGVFGLLVILAGALVVFSAPRWLPLIQLTELLPRLGLTTEDPVASVEPPARDEVPREVNASAGMLTVPSASVETAHPEPVNAVEVDALPTLEETLATGRTGAKRTQSSDSTTHPSVGSGHGAPSSKRQATRAPLERSTKRRRRSSDQTPILHVHLEEEEPVRRGVEVEAEPPARRAPDDGDVGRSSSDRRRDVPPPRTPSGGGMELFDDIK